MKRTELSNTKGKSKEELSKELHELQIEMSKLKLDMIVNKPKDTNNLSQKKKRFAILKTAIKAL